MFSKSSAKYIQSLQHKKFRDDNGVFVAEGDKLVLEMLQSGVFEPKLIFGVEEWFNKHNDLLEKYHTIAAIVSTEELERISGMPSPNKVLGAFYKRSFDMPKNFSGVTLMLDDIRDPGNLGTIIRTADWFGVQHIICSETCVDMYNPKVVQGTMGSINRMKLYYADLNQVIDQHPNIPVCAAVLNGKSVKDMKVLPNCFLVIGNEANGISSALLEKVTYQVSIPGAGTAESLNAAIAAAILLYHFST